MPFSVYSSSVDAGYEITNLHEDTYGSIKDAPMQGPFTYQYVGGNQHRHVPLNKGSDNVVNRPELFNIDFNSGEIRVFKEASSSPQDSIEVLPLVNLNIPRGIALDTAAGMMYWCNAGDKTIYRAPMDGSGPEVLMQTSANDPIEIVLDVDAGIMYWVERNGTTSGHAKSAPMTPLATATDITPTGGLTKNISGIALDVENSLLYYNDSTKIQRCSTAGGSPTDMQTGLSSGGKGGITLDIENQMMYWSENGLAEVTRAPMTPLATKEQLYAGSTIYTIGVDAIGGNLYWISYGDKRIYRAPMDGNGTVEKVLNTPDQSVGMVLDSGARKVYWTGYGGDKIYRAIMFPLPSAKYTRGEVAKRPVNIANHKTYNPLGNYTYDYEVVQTVGRTSNNRAFIDAMSGSYAVNFIGDPNLPYSGSLVTQFVSGARDFMTGTALPNFDLSGSNKTVFVNRFNAPGGPDVSSRGVLDTYAEEYAPNNDLNLRNNAVRSVLRSDLTRHTPKATDITCSVTPTLYHSNNRNTRYYKQTPAKSSYDDIKYIGGTGIRGIALDTNTGMIYWSDIDDDKVYRAPRNSADIGASKETVVSGLNYPLNLALDICAQMIYITDNGDNKIYRAPMEGGAKVEVITGLTTPVGVALDISNGMMYYTDRNPPAKIYRAPMVEASTGEFLYEASEARTIALDLDARMLYWTSAGTTNTLSRAPMDGEGPVETLLSGLDDPWTIALDTSLGFVYYGEIYVKGLDDHLRISRMPINGGPIEILITGNIGDIYALDLDIDAGEIYWTDTINGTISRANTPEKPVYDNGFITHAIPQCSLQYAWIKASAITNRTELLGYQTSGSY